MFPYEFRSRSVLNCAAACAGFPAERTASEFIRGAIVSVLLDEAQLQIADEAQRLLTAHYSGERLKTYLLERGTFDRELWALFGAQGWTAICYPEAFGGLDLGLLELGLVAEACGAAVTGVAALTSSFALGQALMHFGTDEQQSHWLPRLSAGSAIGAFAFAEGQDMLPGAPTLRIEGGRLSGTKPAVTAGGIADAVIVLAQGENGPVLALVDLAQPGITRSLLDTFDNSRCTADLTFDDVEARELPGAADALAGAREILRLQAVIVSFEQVGGAQKMLTAARDYALTRRAFGQPIGAFQSVKHRIAEDYVLVELARANAIHAASRAGQSDFGLYAATARISATEAYDGVSRDAVQVHGGIGVTWEADLHLHQRRARTLSVETGPLVFWEDEVITQLQGTAQ